LAIKAINRQGEAAGGSLIKRGVNLNPTLSTKTIGRSMLLLLAEQKVSFHLPNSAMACQF
jgi:hypothetical protein